MINFFQIFKDRNANRNIDEMVRWWAILGKINDRKNPIFPLFPLSHFRHFLSIFTLFFWFSVISSCNCCCCCSHLYPCYYVPLKFLLCVCVCVFALNDSSFSVLLLFKLSLPFTYLATILYLCFCVQYHCKHIVCFVKKSWYEAKTLRKMK